MEVAGDVASVAATTTTAAAASQHSTIALETSLLSVLRAGLWFVARYYCNVSLFADLRSVSEETDAINGSSTVLESPTRANIALDSVGTAPNRSTNLTKSASPELLTPPTSRPSSRASASGGHLARRTSIELYRVTQTTQNDLATAIFGLAFSESCMLFILLLFGDAVSDRARALNWSISLLALLSLIVLVIPLGLSLLLVHRKKSPSLRTFMITLVPFGGYLFLFDRVGSLVASKVVVEGSHSMGIINAMLSRVCVPGVFLIATLSGGGAVNTAWEAYEMRSISSAENVTDAQILGAERSLYRARLDLQQRTRALELAQGSAAREAESTAGQSLLSRLTSTAPAAAHLKSLQLEVKALSDMEQQIVADVAALKRRKLLKEMNRTFKGRLWLAAGWALSVYCVWRVFISCLNLIAGYTHTRVSSDDSPEAPAPPREGVDLLTSLLTRLAVLLDLDIDIHVWSRLIGLALIGAIMLANMRNVLASVSRIFKATTAGASTAFMLLFLAQLMAMYLLTSLISLPSAHSDTTTSLLETLPSFAVFSRLFDSVFLLAAGSVFVVRWVHGTISKADGVPSAQYV